MDSDRIKQPEIRLEKSSPYWFRLGFAAMVVFALTWEVTGFFLQTNAPSWGSYATLLFILCVGGGVIFGNLFTSNLGWTIRSDEIQIDQNWIDGRQQIEVVKRGDITKIKIASEADEGADVFYIRLWLTSGEDIQSPPVSDAGRARELKAEIVSRLNVPHELVTPRA